MKKIIFVLMFTALIASAASAGVTFSGRAGLYTVPGGGTSSIMYGLAAYYPLTDSLTLRGAASTTTYTIGSVSTTYSPVTIDLIYSRSIAPGLLAYVGGGASYNMINSGGVSSNTIGAQAETGLRLSFAGLDAGVEYGYLVPNFNSSSQGSSLFAAYISSGFSSFMF